MFLVFERDFSVTIIGKYINKIGNSHAAIKEYFWGGMWQAGDKSIGANNTFSWKSFLMPESEKKQEK